MDEYGHGIYADLKYYFGTDLADLFREDSGLTPALVLALIARLPIGSMYYSLQLAEGGDHWVEYLDRGADWYLNTDIYNILVQLMRVTGNWKHKAPKLDPYPLPGARALVEKHRPKTIADVYALFGGAGQH